MSEGFKIFTIIFLISLPFWWGMNLLEGNLSQSLLLKEMATNPRVLIAQANQEFLEQQLREIKPIRDRGIEDFKIEAKSALAIFLSTDLATEKVLFEKDSSRILPIASLTKLMTAHTALENYDLNQIVEISKEAVGEEEDFGNLKIGEKFRVKDLLYLLLIESSNDAAQALAEIIGSNGFVGLMNLEAQNLGLKNTYFINPTGLDPNQSEVLANFSTAKDLTQLAKFIFQKPLIWGVSALAEFDLFSPDGIFHHKLENTNELLKKAVDFQTKIIGGKTGWTFQAQGCLLFVVEAPKSKGYLVNIILGSANRFEEMENLVNWVYKAYQW